MEELDGNSTLEDWFNAAVAATQNPISAEPIPTVSTEAPTISTEPEPMVGVWPEVAPGFTVTADATAIPIINTAAIETIPDAAEVIAEELSRHRLLEQEQEKEIKKAKEEEKIENEFNFLTQTCIDIYGEDHVDVKRSDHSNFTIVIWFPKITITNSNKLTHTITDLYFHMSFCLVRRHDGLRWALNEDVKGRRGSVSTTEFLCGYRHSHLSSASKSSPSDIIKLSSFCLGTGPLAVEFASLKEDGFVDTPENRQKWEMTVTSIQLYVQWESLEGVPYFRMERIVCPETSDSSVYNIWYNNTTFSFRIINLLLREYIHDIIKLLLISIKDNVVKDVCDICVTEEAEEFIASVLINLGNGTHTYEGFDTRPSDLILNKFLVYKDMEGNYVSKESRGGLQEEYVGTYIKFKGELRNLTITDYKKDNENEHEKPKEYPHPEITKQVIACIRTEISTSILNMYKRVYTEYIPIERTPNDKIRRSREKKANTRLGNHNSPYYTRRGNGQDLVPMP